MKLEDISSYEEDDLPEPGTLSTHNPKKDYSFYQNTQNYGNIQIVVSGKDITLRSILLFLLEKFSKLTKLQCVLLFMAALNHTQPTFSLEQRDNNMNLSDRHVLIAMLNIITDSLYGL